MVLRRNEALLGVAFLNVVDALHNLSNGFLEARTIDRRAIIKHLFGDVPVMSSPRH